jgi:outer membrane biosynthesis protein TonB
MPKVYTTMQGRRIDIDKLRARNEQVRAVGNMPVNARGDQVGPGGKVIKTREEVAKDYYNTKAYNEANPKSVANAQNKETKVEVQTTAPVETKISEPKVEIKKPKTVKKTAVKKTETKVETKSVEQPKQETQIETNTASGIDAAFDE